MCRDRRSSKLPETTTVVTEPHLVKSVLVFNAILVQSFPRSDDSRANLIFTWNPPGTGASETTYR